MVLVALLVPLIFLIIPGIFFVRPKGSDVVAILARMALWSITSWILISYISAAMHLAYLAPVILAVIGLSVAYIHRKQWREFPKRGLYIVGGILLALYLILSMTFWQYQHALPTGDSQKAIYWAEQIIRTDSLPDYTSAVTLFNRDPVDFYTPGLHSITAMVLRYSDNAWSSVGYFSLALVIAVVVIAHALLRLVLPLAPSYSSELVEKQTITNGWRTGGPPSSAWNQQVKPSDGGAGATGPDQRIVFQQVPLLFLITWLIITNQRFLRYVREPGYHYQNIAGEVLLFGLLLLGLSLLKRWRLSDAALAVAVGGALILTHQFSAFIAAFALLPVVALLAARLPKVGLLAIGGAVSVLVLIGFYFGLLSKIPHLFTWQPHLLPYVAPLLEYPATLGYLWVYGGIAGLWVLAHMNARKQWSTPQVGFIACSLMLLLLSRGPQWGLDIPPVRALFYSVVPLAIATAVFYYALYRHTQARLVSVILIIFIAGAGITSLFRAFPPNHAVRTNSTLTDTQQKLLAYTQAEEDAGALLIDDYNRRANSWLLLSGRPLFARLGADIRTMMQEAEQSPLRRGLYERQLDYEKIYALGNSPIIAPLLSRHGITYLTANHGSSMRAFAENPLLTAVIEASDTTLFKRTDLTIPPLSAEDAWLLQPTTLMNNIGDDEDTYEHLLASVRTARLSAPQQDDGKSVRFSSAAHITLRFNVRDFVLHSWGQPGATHPGGDVVLLIRTTTNQAYTARTTTGYTTSLGPADQLVRIPAAAVPYEADGFITLFIENPTESPLGIDLIALGLAP